MNFYEWDILICAVLIALLAVNLLWMRDPDADNQSLRIVFFIMIGGFVSMFCAITCLLHWVFTLWP